MTTLSKAGLLEHLNALGWALRIRDGVLVTARSPLGLEDQEALQTAIDAYDSLPVVKAWKIDVIKSDGLARISAVFPAIQNFDLLDLVVNIVRSIAPAARQLTPELATARDIWQAGQDAIAEVQAATTEAQVDAVTPVWPL